MKHLVMDKLALRFIVLFSLITDGWLNWSWIIQRFRVFIRLVLFFTLMFTTVMIEMLLVFTLVVIEVMIHKLERFLIIFF